MPRGDDRRDPLIIFRAPQPWKDRLYAHAAEQGLSVSDVARAAIDAVIPEAPGDTQKAASAPPTPRTTRRGPGVCPHRVKLDAYCRRCQASAN